MKELKKAILSQFVVSYVLLAVLVILKIFEPKNAYIGILTATTGVSFLQVVIGVCCYQQKSQDKKEVSSE